MKDFNLREFSGEDWDWHYGFTSFKDKVIVDLGADWGSTAKYFLDKGAKKVIAVEPLHYDKLVENIAGDERVIPIKKFMKTSYDYEELIKEYKPDIMKIDIDDRDEIHFLQCKSELVKSVPEYLIETHAWLDNEMISELVDFYLTKLGYEVKWPLKSPKENKLLDVAYARKK